MSEIGAGEEDSAGPLGNEIFVITGEGTRPFDSLKEAGLYVQQNYEIGNHPLIIRGKRIEIEWDVEEKR